MYHKLQIDKRGVATILLNRPELHNAFNDEMIRDLTAAIKELSANDAIRLLIIKGVGKSFCAGADLNWMKRMKDYSYEENLNDSKKLAELFSTLNSFPKPTIGCVNGAALGGGAGLVACCDYVIAIDTAQFGFTEVRLGLLPAVISPFVIAKIGESQARASFLSGVRFDTNRAMRMGLIHQISSFDKLDEDLEVAVKDYLMAAPLASATAKKLIFNVLGKTISEASSYTCDAISKARVSDEGQEGMSALLEKRKVSWL